MKTDREKSVGVEEGEGVHSAVAVGEAIIGRARPGVTDGFEVGIAVGLGVDVAGRLERPGDGA